jgi:hypothetical protein
MKYIMSYLLGGYIRWFGAINFLAVLIAFSSCSTNREASLAYMDDIYKPYDVNYLMTIYNDHGGVSDQDASVIKPYQPVVPDYYAYTKPINFSMSFGFGSYYPSYRGGFGNYYRPYGSYTDYYNVGNYYGCYPPSWYMNPYSGYNDHYYPYYNGGYGDYGGSTDGSYLYGNNLNYFHGVNSSERYKGSSGINYSTYVYYRAAGASGVAITGRQSGSSGKSRHTNILNSGKTNTSKSSNYNGSSKSNSKSFFQSTGSQGSQSGGSVSPSRSSGSGGGSYTGKRPR